MYYTVLFSQIRQSSDGEENIVPILTNSMLVTEKYTSLGSRENTKKSTHLKIKKPTPQQRRESSNLHLNTPTILLG
jgi:hypothetical protein